MVELKDVSFGYRPGQALYENLNLSLRPGAIYGLLGPNGVGKSTLLRLMAGLLYPKAGQLHVGPYVPADRKPAFLEDLFFVPEEFYMPPTSIGAFIDGYAPYYPRFDRNKMLDFLTEFGLHTDYRLHQLSYGQKKKVLIGFGLAATVGLLLMDEPTNGLDIPSKSQFRRLVAGALDDRQTVVISTHQVRDLEALIDPVIILNDRQVVLNASVEEITARLWFGVLPELDTYRRELFSERALGGYAVVTQNLTGDSSRLDLEQLFTAAQAHPQRMRELFVQTLTHVQP